FKVAFLRQFEPGSAANLRHIAEITVNQVFAYDPVPYALLGLAVALCLLASWTSQSPTARRTLWTFAAASFAVALVVVAAAPMFRPILRDVLWFHAPINMMAVMALMAAARPLQEGGRRMGTVVLLVPLLVAGLHLVRVPSLLLRADLNF